MPITIKKSLKPNTFLIETILPENYRKIRFEIQSDRNFNISSFTDVSPLDPDPTPGKDRYPNDSNVWFPVVDVKLEALMYAKAYVTDVAYCHMNSFFNFDQTTVRNGEATFTNNQLTNWENGLFIPSKEARVEKFSIIKEFFAAPTINQRVHCEFETLTKDWGGKVSIQYQNNDGVWIEFEATEIVRKRDTQFTEKGVNNEIESLNLCLEYLMNSYNVSETSPYRDGLYLFYDADADTYRQGQWPWSWGTAIRLLLDCAELVKDTDVKIKYTAQELIDIAHKIGLTTLKFVIHNPGHPAHQFGTTRYTARNWSKHGHQELVNTGADTGFLCGWGWAKLYEVTGDRNFLDAAVGFADALVPVLDKFVIPPQEWLPEPNDWTDFTIDESAFATEGLEALYQITGEEKYKDLCLEYMDKHLVVFDREDGLWEREYKFPTKTIAPTGYMARGLGWAMEGLLATHRCAPETKIYLEKAIKMAEVLIDNQREDGSWAFIFNEPAEVYGIAEKGTALWSLLLFMLHEETNDERHLAAARKALKWCMDNQYIGSNPHAYGGIISPSGESAVTYRSYYNVCCQYTSSFVGLAILKNLKLS